MNKNVRELAGIAMVLNHRNSVRVNRKGIINDPAVLAGWFLGINGNYQHHITANNLLNLLLKIACGFDMRLYLQNCENKVFLVCEVNQGARKGTGYYPLKFKGMPHTKEDGAEKFIRAAATLAKEDYYRSRRIDAICNLHIIQTGEPAANMSVA